MRLARLGIAVMILGASAGANAATVVIYVDSMTLDRYVRIYDTPGRDRVLMCMAPPATSGCTELPLKHAA